eukprot:5390881-Pleurochrysis_carterae.AAC.1
MVLENIPPPLLRSLLTQLPTYSSMSTTRLCLAAVETWAEIGTKSSDGPIVEGRSACSFARQNGGDVSFIETLT